MVLQGRGDGAASGSPEVQPVSLLQRLWAEWRLQVEAHSEETMETYLATVKGGNTQTYEEFMEELRVDWFVEMAKNA